jgi:hypothetical protein
VFKRVDLHNLPLWAALLPFVTFNVCYLIAASLQHVPTCFTYLEGCTSVSSTGRNAPEFWIFKAGVLSLAAVLALVWLRTANFLQASGLSSARVNLLRVLAIISVITLSLYVITLGLPNEEFGRLRRIGTTGFAFSSWLTQIVFVLLYWPLRQDTTRRAFRWLAIMALALLMVGVASETAKLLGTPRKTTNNIAAWNAFLMLSGYYLVLARLWWHHGISAGRPASPKE